MKIRHILPNDRPDTIAKYQTLLLEANPDCELDGLNINPLKKDKQREGEFEVDFILKHKDEKLIENTITEATKTQADKIASLELEKINLSKQIDDLISPKTKQTK